MPNTVIEIAAIVGFLAIAGLWAAANMKGRGAFSALLAMVATLAAGAVAFGLYQTVLNLLLPMAGTGGTFSRLIESTMYGLALLLPFVVSLAIFRVALDLLIPGNLKTPAAADFLGGFLFGAVNGLVTVGVVVLSLGMMRFGADMGFFGHDPISDEALVYEDGMMPPFDEITVGLYDYFSLNTLATSTPLAMEYPRFHEHAATLRRIVSNDGLGRIGLSRNDFAVLGGYMLGDDEDASVSELAGDLFGTREVEPQWITGERVVEGSTLLGVALRFDAGAVDAGQVILGPGQLRLVVDNGARGDALRTDAVHPYAFIARSDDAADEELGTEAFPYYRYKVEAGSWFIGSVGGESSHYFIAEFFVPPGYQPRTLFVKGVPVNVRPGDPESALEIREIGLPAADAGSPMMNEFLQEQLRSAGVSVSMIRDVALLEGSLLRTFGIPTGSGDAADLASAGFDVEGAVVADPGAVGVSVSNRFPNRYRMMNQTKGGLAVNDNREVTGGEHTFLEETLTDRDVPRDIRIDVFAETATTRVVQLELTDDNGALTPIGEIVASMPATAMPDLVAADGQTTAPIGFISVSGDQVEIRFTPDRPVQALRELPDLPTAQRRENRTWLIYRVSEGTAIRGVVSGDEALLLFEPTLEVRRR